MQYGMMINGNFQLIAHLLSLRSKFCVYRNNENPLKIKKRQKNQWKTWIGYYLHTFHILLQFDKSFLTQIYHREPTNERTTTEEKYDALKKRRKKWNDTKNKCNNKTGFFCLFVCRGLDVHLFLSFLNFFRILSGYAHTHTFDRFVDSFVWYNRIKSLTWHGDRLLQ